MSAPSVQESVVKALMSRIKTRDIKTTSELGVRDEKIQRRKFVQTIPRHKYEEKATHKILIPMEIALPYNVETGIADDHYNEDNKFRPPVSATSAALAIKGFANEVEKLKETLMVAAGYTDWDTSDITKLNRDDWAILGPYRRARVFTDTVAVINNKNITGYDNGVKYSVAVNRDEYGNVIGKMPTFLMANKFFRDMNGEEANHLKELREEKDPNWREKCKSTVKSLESYNLIAMEDKKFKKELLRDVYSQGIVSDERPDNYYIAYRFELDPSTNLIKGFDRIKTMTLEDLDKSLVLLKQSKDIRETLELFNPGKSYARMNIHFDFIELDFLGPESVDAADDSTKRMMIAADTKISSPSITLEKVDDGQNPDYPSGYSDNFYASLVGQVIKKQDDLEGIERRFKASTKSRPLDAEVEELIVREMQRINYLANKPAFATKEVLLRNKEFLLLVYEDDAEDFFAELEADLADVVDGTITDGSIEDDLSEVELTAEDAIDSAGESAYKSEEVEELEIN